MATKAAIGYRKRETLGTVIKEGTEDALRLWGKPDGATSSSCNQQFGVRFRETQLGFAEKYPTVYGPHVIIVENLRGYLSGLRKADWRQIPTKRAFIELCRAKNEQDRVHKLWRKAEGKKARACDRAAQTEKRLLHGGLIQVGYAKYNCDGYRVFNLESIKPYTDLRFDARVQSRLGKDGVRTIAMRRKLTPNIVYRFYPLWRDASGYCNPFGSLRKLIIPIKEKIIVWLLAEAKSKGWSHGIKHETWSQGSILYIDTPEGQVSFHRPPMQSTLPAYSGEWSGLRNSDLIIRRLLGEDVCTTPEVGVLPQSTTETVAQGMAAQ